MDSTIHLQLPNPPLYKTNEIIFYKKNEGRWYMNK